MIFQREKDSFMTTGYKFQDCLKMSFQKLSTVCQYQLVSLPHHSV